MFIRRLFPRRWATILAWTGAAVAWGSVGIATAESAPAPDDPVEPVTITTETQQLAAVPAQPENGLVVIRYTPSERPAAEVITRTVTQTASAAAPRVTSTAS